MSRSTDRTALRRRFVRQLALTSAGAAFVAVSAGAACSDDGPISPAKPRIVYSAAQSLGQGTARSYVTLDNANRPISVGVAFSENVMSGLPSTMIPGTPYGAMLTLPLPAEAAATGLKHVMVQWNPMGHEPDHVYTHPHFDFHFYSIAANDVMAIMPESPDY